MTPTRPVDDIIGAGIGGGFTATAAEFKNGPPTLELVKLNSKAQTAHKELSRSKVGYKRALEFKEKLVFDTPCSKK